MVGHQVFLATWVQVAAFLTYWLEAYLVTSRRRREQHGRSSAVPYFLSTGGSLPHLLAGGVPRHHQKKEGATP